jgi:hypothetical protein
VSAFDGTRAPSLTSSQQEWLHVRAYLHKHRRELSALAAEQYPDAFRVAGTSLLGRQDWLPATALALDAVVLERSAIPFEPAVRGTEPFTEHLRPERPDGSRYPSYSAAMAELAAPRVFHDRSTYRLESADLTGECPRLGFGSGTFFDSVDVGEACAHEFGAARLGLVDATPLRDAVCDPCDPALRPTNVAVATLTLRHDRTSGEASFPLHWRDPAKVGHAGGLCMVIPVGVFQAAGDESWHAENDFSLWRCMLREFAEELLGEPEDHDDGPVDYGSWPLATRMSQAWSDGSLRAHVVGLGVDPLTLATDLLTVVSIEAGLYDELFGQIVQTNEEGRLSYAAGTAHGRWPFTGESVHRLSTDEPMQAAGTALLRCAWDHRDVVR